MPGRGRGTERNNTCSVDGGRGTSRVKISTQLPRQTSRQGEPPSLTFREPGGFGCQPAVTFLGESLPRERNLHSKIPEVFTVIQGGSERKRG